MFEFIRKHSKIVMVLMFLLIIPSFVLFGIDGYSRSAEKGASVATVDGRAITQGEWDAAHAADVERMRSQMPGVDAKLFDSPAARYASLERIVRERVMLAAAIKAHIAPSDARLAKLLRDDPGIAAMRAADGTLDMNLYRDALARQGMTPQTFENRVRSDLAVRQVIDGVVGSSFVSAAQADAALSALHEQREIQVLTFKPADFSSKVVLTDADLETYYASNKARFQVAEQADVEYVVLDLDGIKQTLTVGDDELQAGYDQYRTRVVGQEERRASHILITVPKDAPAAEREQAKVKATELLGAVRKTPSQFAELARKNSQDPGSAANGGDLDFFARGAMVKPFEDAAFSLKKGEISDVVTSDFGFHIIQLTDVRTPKLRTFAEMRPELEAEIKQRQAQKKFAELAETFTNTVYEQSDSLKPAADRLQLPLRTAAGVTRTPAAGITGAMANPRLLAALFAPDAVEKKRNTEATEIGPSQLAAARIVRYAPARTPPLEEVRAEVRTALLADRAAELARSEGAQRLAAWKAAPVSASGFPAATKVSRADDKPQQPGAVVDAAMRAPTDALPVFVGADLGAAGYAVVRVNKVEPRAPVAPSNTQQERAQIEQRLGSVEGLAYYNLLKDRFKAQLKVPKPLPASTVG